MVSCVISLIGLALILIGIAVGVSPIAEILVVWGVIVLLGLLLFIVEALKVRIETENNDPKE